MHEASLHQSNSFVTLTYDDQHYVPTLIYSHFQDFMKRLRKKRPDLRFYMAGEYGGKLGRPHFHALLFNCAFPDMYQIRGGANPLFRSPFLESKWTAGFSSIGAVTFESAAYVARYCLPKINGDLADKHYQLPAPWIDPDTGEIHTHRHPEFNHMSLKNAVGRDWLRLYWSDCREGKIIVNHKEANVPRYYLDYFKNSSYGAAIKAQRAIDGLSRLMDNTPSRRAVKAHIAQQRVSQQLPRSL